MRLTKKFWQVVCGVSVAGFLGCGAYLMSSDLELAEVARSYEILRELVKEGAAQFGPIVVQAEELMIASVGEEREESIDTSWESMDTEAAVSEKMDSENRSEETEILQTELEQAENSVIDFAQLTQINGDIYAWIEIPGMEVDYPVLQSAEDDVFYLSHGYNKEESEAGAIYSESYSSKDFGDFQTILYGHDMRDNSMFGSLLQLEDGGMMSRNNLIRIYLPDRTLEYQIFAAYPFSSKHLLLNYDFSEELERIGYLAEIGYTCETVEAFDRELFETLDAGSHILTLSTCYHGDSQRRFLVQAVLLEDGQGEM